jgi:hypothetical protein
MDSAMSSSKLGLAYNCRRDFDWSGLAFQEWRDPVLVWQIDIPKRVVVKFEPGLGVTRTRSARFDFDMSSNVMGSSKVLEVLGTCDRDNGMALQC